MYCSFGVLYGNNNNSSNSVYLKKKKKKIKKIKKIKIFLKKKGLKLPLPRCYFWASSRMGLNTSEEPTVTFFVFHINMDT